MRNQAILKMAAAGMMAVAMMAAPGQIQAQGSDTVLKPAEMQKLLPASVYYHGQLAPTQLRNSAGVTIPLESQNGSSGPTRAVPCVG